MCVRSVLFTYTKSPMLTGHPSTTPATTAQDGTLVVVVALVVVVDRVVRVAREASSTTTRVCVCARAYGTVRYDARDVTRESRYRTSPHSWRERIKRSSRRRARSSRDDAGRDGGDGDVVDDDGCGARRRVGGARGRGARGTSVGRSRAGVGARDDDDDGVEGEGEGEGDGGEDDDDDGVVVEGEGARATVVVCDARDA